VTAASSPRPQPDLERQLSAAVSFLDDFELSDLLDLAV
jgi:hypothetical protein